VVLFIAADYDVRTAPSQPGARTAAANGGGMADHPNDRAVEATVRDHLANERTFLAYLRTALALIGFGFVLARLDPHARLSLAVGVGMVVGGVAVMLFGAWRYLDERRALLDHRWSTLGPGAAVAIAAGAGVLGLVAMFALIRLAP
jgi:putative membrane protein